MGCPIRGSFPQEESPLQPIWGSMNTICRKAPPKQQFTTTSRLETPPPPPGIICKHLSVSLLWVPLGCLNVPHMATSIHLLGALVNTYGNRNGKQNGGSISLNLPVVSWKCNKDTNTDMVLVDKVYCGRLRNPLLAPPKKPNGMITPRFFTGNNGFSWFLRRCRISSIRIIYKSK